MIFRWEARGRQDMNTERKGADQISNMHGGLVRPAACKGSPPGVKEDENSDLANFSSQHSPKGATRNGWLRIKLRSHWGISTNSFFSNPKARNLAQSYFKNTVRRKRLILEIKFNTCVVLVHIKNIHTWYREKSSVDLNPSFILRIWVSWDCKTFPFPLEYLTSLDTPTPWRFCSSGGFFRISCSFVACCILR